MKNSQFFKETNRSNGSNLSIEKVKASFLNEIVPKIRLDPLPEDSPRINLLVNQVSESEYDPVCDAVLKELKPGQGTMFETRMGGVVIYYNDGGILHIMDSLPSADIKDRMLQYSEGSFSFEEYEETTSEAVYYIIQPNTKNLLDRGEERFKKFSAN